MSPTSFCASFFRCRHPISRYVVSIILLALPFLAACSAARTESLPLSVEPEGGSITLAGAPCERIASEPFTYRCEFSSMPPRGLSGSKGSSTLNDALTTPITTPVSLSLFKECRETPSSSSIGSARRLFATLALEKLDPPEMVKLSFGTVSRVNALVRDGEALVQVIGYSLLKRSCTLDIVFWVPKSDDPLAFHLLPLQAAADEILQMIGSGE